MFFVEKGHIMQKRGFNFAAHSYDDKTWSVISIWTLDIFSYKGYGAVFFLFFLHVYV